jgi:endonuclease/exonuclease/phosphatase family metal-dependent hydrolase
VPHRTRVLIYNVKFLPPLGRLLEPPLLRSRGFWELGKALRSDEVRARILAEHLTGDPRFDVIVLCELFASHARQTFGAAFERLGYHVATCPPKGGLFASSGLFVASRLPILEREFSPYDTASGSDRFARKGILHVKLGPPERAFDLFATHLQAHPEGFVARSAQLAHARSFIDRRVDARTSSPTLIGGDMNVIGETGDRPTPEYQAMREIFHDFTDLHHLLSGGRPHPTWDPRENAQMIGTRYVDLERLDYLWLRSGDAARGFHVDAAVDVLRFEHEGLPLSDHYALSFELPLFARS